MADLTEDDEPEPQPKLMSAKEMTAVGVKLAGKAWCGFGLGSKGAIFNANYIAKPVWEQAIHATDGMYERLTMRIDCVHCPHTRTVGAGKDGKLATFNAGKYNDHLLKCIEMPSSNRSKVLEHLSINRPGGKAGLQRETEDRKRVAEEQTSREGDDAVMKEEVKKAKTVTPRAILEEERQSKMDRWVVLDAVCTAAHFQLCMIYLAAAFIMCRIPFAVIDSPFFRKVTCMGGMDYVCKVVLLGLCVHGCAALCVHGCAASGLWRSR
jgi:hypothetical protein